MRGTGECRRAQCGGSIAVGSGAQDGSASAAVAGPSCSEADSRLRINESRHSAVRGPSQRGQVATHLPATTTSPNAKSQLRSDSHYSTTSARASRTHPSSPTGVCGQFPSAARSLRARALALAFWSRSIRLRQGADPKVGLATLLGCSPTREVERSERSDRLRRAADVAQRFNLPLMSARALAVAAQDAVTTTTSCRRPTQ